MTTIPIIEDSSTANGIVRGVRGLNSLHQGRQRREMFRWQVERGARHNYRRLGRRLAKVNRSLFRNGAHGQGLIQVLGTGEHRLVSRAAGLAPIIVDSLALQVIKGGKVTGDLPATMHLNAMLASEAFLAQFRPVDRVAVQPLYLADFSLAQYGYQDRGEEGCLLYLGPELEIVDGVETIARFLDVMDFATNADRSNTVAAALTVLLRNHWPGSKPVVVVTATKTHAGKGTIVEFVRGGVAQADILYEGVDWPMQSRFQQQYSRNPDVGMMVLDNVRLDSAGGRGRFIRSAFLESFLTSPEIHLACPGAGHPARLENRFVVAITTNDGMLSPDLLNRALPARAWLRRLMRCRKPFWSSASGR